MQEDRNTVLNTFVFRVKNMLKNKKSLKKSQKIDLYQ